MPRSSGGAQNLRRGDRVQVKLNSCYRYYLNGLIGEVTCVLDYGAVVALDSDPLRCQPWGERRVDPGLPVDEGAIAVEAEDIEVVQCWQGTTSVDITSMVARAVWAREEIGR